MSLLTELTLALRRNWPYYLAEAVGLGVFMLCSTLLTLALEHPASGLHQALVAQGAGDLLRRVPLGVGMGLVIVGLAYHPWGKRSGAHINPAVTLAFWQLGKMRRADVFWYILAQAGGGLGATLLLKVVLGTCLGHPRINFTVTQPGPGGAGLAFAAEFGISFVLMLVLLLSLHSARLRKATGWFVGVLITGYIIWETPYSGMSLNPARSLASAVAARNFADLWLYLVAPPAAMGLATVFFQRFHPGLATDQELARNSAAEPPHYPNPAP
ncbi:aquaporin [Hymenobacter fastidiosus]|uniref:Aquaporin n=1 Tax=Hymenobacter fastidiosus TaxID=486264 RepID=A0ABP7ST14_9BACT